MTLKLLTFWRVALSLVCVGLALGHRRFVLHGSSTTRAIHAGLLILVAFGGYYLYLERGPQFHRTRVERLANLHDFYHYYLGSKYFRELGYYNLYDCTVAADLEGDQRVDPDWLIRDLRTLRMKRASTFARDTRLCKRGFGDERWEEFRGDVHTLTRWMGVGMLKKVLQDKGYNATPPWNALISPLANAVPLENKAGMFALLSLDLLFTLGIFVAVGLTFGWRSALFVAAFWSLNFMTAAGFSRGSISRVDWLACLVGAWCLIRRGRYAAAGVLGGLATGLRVFPVLFFAGLGFKLIHDLVRRRTLTRRYVRFFAAFALTLGLLVGLTAATSKGRESWRHFSDNITMHDDKLAGYRVGLKYAIVDAGARGSTRARDALASRWPLRWGAQLLVLTVVFLAAPRLSDERTMALAFVLVVFLTAPTFYYYQMLVVPFLLFLPEDDRWRWGVGMSVFFGWSILGYALRLQWPLGYTLSHWLSWSLIGLSAILVAGVFALDWGDEPRAEAV